MEGVSHQVRRAERRVEDGRTETERLAWSRHRIPRSLRPLVLEAAVLFHAGDVLLPRGVRDLERDELAVDVGRD